jgi:hypothetical protein
MLDFNKINSQVDLKNLDAAQLSKILSEHQNTVIKSALIIGTLIAGWVMFNDHRVKDQSLRSQMTQVQQKIDAIKSRDASIKELDAFKASLPKKLNEFELTTLISNYARSYHVKIPSLSPAESEDKGLYDNINVKFTATADNFKDMMLFLRKIERSEFPLMINSWSGNQELNGEVDFEITISAVLFHS